MTLPYERQNGESLIDWKVRLFDNKTSYNLNSQQIADIINENTGQIFGESSYRKWYRVFDETRSHLSSKNLSNSEIIDEIEEKRIELEKIKIQVADQRREYKKLIREQSRVDDLHSIIRDSIRVLEQQKPIQWIKPLEATSDNQAVLLLSDLHVGMDIDSYFNTYNIDVFIERMIKLASKTITYCKRHGVKKLNLLILSDLVHGIIHTTGRINANENVVRQIQICAEAIAEFVCELANNIEDVQIYFTRGNHDRITPDKHESIPQESFADIVLWFLKTRLENCKNVNFNKNTYNDEIIMFDIYGEKAIAVHGHKDSVQSVIKNIPQLFGFVVNYVFLGHYHHNFEKDNGRTEVMINGSLCGVDQYAIDRRLFARPMQKLMIFTEEDGRECSYNIKL